MSTQAVKPYEPAESDSTLPIVCHHLDALASRLEFEHGRKAVGEGLLTVYADRARREGRSKEAVLHMVTGIAALLGMVIVNGVRH